MILRAELPARIDKERLGLGYVLGLPARLARRVLRLVAVRHFLLHLELYPRFFNLGRVVEPDVHFEWHGMLLRAVLRIDGDGNSIAAFFREHLAIATLVPVRILELPLNFGRVALHPQVDRCAPGTPLVHRTCWLWCCAR